MTNVQIPLPSRKTSREIPIIALTIPVRNIIWSSEKIRNRILQPAKLDRVKNIQQTTIEDANSSQPIPFLSSDLNRLNATARLARDTQLARVKMTSKLAAAVRPLRPVEGLDEVFGFGLLEVVGLRFTGCGDDEAVRREIDQEVDKIGALGDAATVSPGDYWEQDAFGELFGGIN